MTKAKLIDLLQDIPDDGQIVICTQKRHTLYGDIQGIEPHIEDDEDTDEDDIRKMKIDCYVMHFSNEGYSPAQALRWTTLGLESTAKKLLRKILNENAGV